MAQMDQLDHRGLQALLAQMEQTALLARRDQLDHKEAQVLLAQMAQMDQLAHRGLQALLAQTALLDHREAQVLLALMDQLDRRGLLAQQAQMEQMVLQVLLAQMVPLDHRGLLAHRATVSQVLLVRRDLQGQQDRLAQVAVVGLMYFYFQECNHGDNIQGLRTGSPKCYHSNNIIHSACGNISSDKHISCDQ
jgi:hypothetical protein